MRRCAIWGSAGSNTTADHLQVLGDAITALPPKFRRRLKIPATWPWADDIATAWARITALPQAP